MKVIVISGPNEKAGEMETLTSLFEAGLERFHLRKPNYSTQQMREYLNRVPAKYYNRIVIHSHHELCLRYKLAGIHLTGKHKKQKYWLTWLRNKYLKMRLPELEITTGFHTLGSLAEDQNKYAYVFLSPVFDSISKIGYRSTFNEDSLAKVVRGAKTKVFALGGVDEDKIERASELGFYGVALLGSIWKSGEPLSKFKRILASCNSSVNT